MSVSSLSAAEQFIDDAISSHQSHQATTTNDGDHLNNIVENKLQVLKELKELYAQKLWHQLTESLELTVANQSLFPSPDDGELLVNLYKIFVNDFEERLNALRLARVAVHVSSRCKNREEAIEFLTSAMEKIKTTRQTSFEEAVVYVRLHIALLYLHGGDESKAKTEVAKDAKQDLAQWKAPDPSVSAAYHYLAAQLYKHNRDFANFYGSGILYMAYVDATALGDEVATELAVDLALAALLGEGVYNFAEFLAHPISKYISKENGSEFGWLLDMVQVFNDGDLNAYDLLCERYAEQLNGQPALVAHERKLREKITILAFLRIVFELPAEKREIDLADIAVRTKLTVDGVEYLLMKTLSAGLIRGEIDEVSSKVVVTWAMPRILLKPQIRELADRLDQWIAKVSSTTASLQSELMITAN